MTIADAKNRDDSQDKNADTAPAQPDLTKVAELEAVVSGLQKQLTTIAAERDNFRTQLQETLQSNQQTIQNASERLLQMKEQEWSGKIDNLKADYEKRLSATTTELHKLKIESAVTSSGINWRPDAIDMVKELVNQRAKIDQETGAVIVEGGGTLSAYLDSLQKDKPFLVQSKVSGGTGSNPDSQDSAKGEGAASLPEGFEQWDKAKQVKFFLENPSLRKANLK